MVKPTSQDILNTAVNQKGNNPELLNASVADRTILKGADLQHTSYSGNPDVYGVEVRVGAGGSKYEYPIFYKGSKSAEAFRQSMASQKGEDTAEFGGMYYDATKYSPVDLSKTNIKTGKNTGSEDNSANNTSRAMPWEIDDPEARRQEKYRARGYQDPKDAVKKATNNEQVRQYNGTDVALASAELATLVAGLIPGGIGASSSLVSGGIGTARQIREDGFQLKDLLPFAAGAGTAALSFIPGANAGKIITGIRNLAKTPAGEKVIKGLLIGAGGTQVYQNSKFINKLFSDEEWTSEDTTALIDALSGAFMIGRGTINKIGPKATTTPTTKPANTSPLAVKPDIKTVYPSGVQPKYNSMLGEKGYVPAKGRPAYVPPAKPINPKSPTMGRVKESPLPGRVTNTKIKIVGDNIVYPNGKVEPIKIGAAVPGAKQTAIGRLNDGSIVYNNGKVLRPNGVLQDFGDPNVAMQLKKQGGIIKSRYAKGGKI